MDIMSTQRDLFGPSIAPSLPEGVRYAEEVLSRSEEQSLIADIAALELTPFQFQGFTGNRRTISFGWRYDFNGGGFMPAEEMPTFVLPLRQRAADLADLNAEEFKQALVIEYTPGAGIGWHKDRPQFGKVVGFSLLNSCRFRFRRRDGERWERITLNATPRSAYLLDGVGRWEWEHSIPPVEALRYSVTFRTLSQ